MASCFLIGGLLCLAYYGALALFGGMKTGFSLFWLICGLLCLIGYFWSDLARRNPGKFGLPLPLKVFLIVSTILGIGLFVFVEGHIISGMRQQEKEAEPGYIIVLGATVKGTEPSATLRHRLDKAALYWADHPAAILIVCGGLGDEAEITEADAMYDYLVDLGVAPGRIVKENRSTNTRENLENSMQMLQYTDAPAAVITSNFHLFRAGKIAEDITDRDIYQIPVKTDLLLLPHYMVREGFALIKDWFFGNLG